MGYTQNGPLATGSKGTPAPAVLEALANAVTSEARLLGDLVGIMRRQRAAVAAEDLQAVDDSVYATHRVLVTLAEARRRRRSVNELVDGTEELPLRSLEEVLGDRMTDELRTAREGLHAAALTLSREVEVNRTVLREALAAGTDYVRAAFGGPEPKLLYGAEPGRPAAEGRRGGGVLLNRTA